MQNSQNFLDGLWKKDMFLATILALKSLEKILKNMMDKFDTAIKWVFLENYLLTV